MRHNYQHIGTVEFGGSIDALLQTLQETFDVDYAVGIHQDVFEKARRLEASADDIILGETVYYSFSTPETQALTASLADQQELPKRWTYERRRFFLHALPITDFSGNTVGTLLISVDRTEASAALAREIRLIVLGSILILVVAISVLFAILGQAFAPIRAIIATTDKVAQGNFDITLDHQRSDEIGAIQQGLAQILRQLCPAIGQVKVNAGEIQQAGHQLSHAANQLAAGVTEQATNAETISSSLTAISVTVSENTAHSARTAAIAERASTDVTKVSEAVLGTRDVIHQIQTKITNIDYIARNTHLLAINASIEASAAGSDGKGFGVIAKDVRRLAQQVQDMAKEIEQLVHQSVNEADESARRLSQLAPNLVESNRLIAEVYEASQQQDDEVRQIMQAMTQLETVIQQNAANSEQLTAMAARFCNRAEALQSAVDYFHIGQTQSIKPAV
jgi:methyl-accepting chemotaxis protein